MPILRDLEGIKEKELTVEFFRKVSEIKGILDSKKAAMAARENGAIHFWKDDDGLFRCEAMRYYQTLDNQKFSDFKDVKKWAKKWLKEIK